jgi:lysophospholipid acyltransferase (LPLAT)-like uncharacterized protein
MREGRPAAFTVDGPRGPARIAQPGALWLAQATGNPVVPFHIEAAKYWTTRSWDRHQIPKPGTTVAVTIGEPIYVAHGSGEQAVEEARVTLEESLVRLERRATRLAGREDPSKPEVQPEALRVRSHER